MKTLGLCCFFLSFSLLAIAPVGAQSRSLGFNTDKTAIHKFLMPEGQSAQRNRFDLSPQDNSFVLSLDELEPGCMYMSTYRVKREAGNSDSTRPAGYTTCVPMGRFAMKSAVIRDNDSEVGQSAPAR